MTCLFSLTSRAHVDFHSMVVNSGEALGGGLGAAIPPVLNNHAQYVRASLQDGRVPAFPLVEHFPFLSVFRFFSYARPATE